MSIPKIQIGQRFEKLLVIEKTSIRETGYVVWKCKCDCGNEKLVKSSNLTFGVVKSCGCLPTGRGRILPKTVASSNKLYHRYKRDALDRELEFSLTKDEFLHFSTKPCYYCGKEPEQISKDNMNYNGEFIYNGIDRVDNNFGYTFNNCVSCCKECNSKKKSITPDMAIKMLTFLGYKVE